MFSITAASINRKWSGLRQCALGADGLGSVRLDQRDIHLWVLMLQAERKVEHSGIGSEKPLFENRGSDQRAHSWFGCVGTCRTRAEPHLRTGLSVGKSFGRKSKFTALQTGAVHVTENAKHLVIPGNS